MKRLLTILLGITMMLGLVGPAAGEEKPLEEIVIYVPGDAPAALAEVEKAIEDACRDELNIDLTFIYAGWDDYGGKLQMSLAAGQKRSLVYDARATLTSSIAGGYYQPLEDLLPVYAPNLVATKTEAVLEANMHKGPDGEYHQYGIPLGNFKGRALQFLVRKDIREELGIDPIATKEALVDFAYAVKENYPAMNPIMNGRAAGNTIAAMFNAFEIYDVPGYTWMTPIDWNGVFYFKNNDGIVYNIFDDMPDPIWENILLARQLYEDGIIHPDVMSLPSWYDKIQDGSSAIGSGGDIGIPGSLQAAVEAAVPGAELEGVTLYDFEQDGMFPSDFRAWDYLFVPATNTEENTIRSLEFLNWVAASQENYDLCAYGILGDTWNPVGENQFEVDPTRWAAETWTWLRNSAYERYDSNFNEYDLERIARFHDPDFFEASVLAGFSFNADPVNTELSQYNVALQKYWFAIQNGAVDPEEGMQKFKDEAYDAVLVVSAEMQAQINEYLDK